MPSLEPFDAFEMPPLPPDAAIRTGAVGGGKTYAAVDEILRLRALSAFGAVWVLTASGAQAIAFRQRLLARSPDGVQFGVEFFTFDTLYRRLLDLAGDPQREVAPITRFHVLRRVIADLCAAGTLDLFGAIAATPGFVAAAARVIDELKQALIFPEDFERVAHARDRKAQEIAAIYGAYQRLLRDRGLVDRHGAGWVALEHLRAGDPLARDVKLLVVDGFDQFNRVHVELLAALATQAGQTLLTLTDVADGRAPRFRRFRQTRARLEATGGGVWRVEPLPGADYGRAPALQTLIDTIFAAGADPAPAGDALRLIEAPDVGREVSAVLRRVKRLLLAGVAPDGVLIVARDLARYGGALRETARAYGIPLVVREGGTLPENPAVAAFLALVDLAAMDFPRREMLDVLRSPYLAAPGLAPDQIAALERISQERQVVRGRVAWLDAVRNAARPLVDEDGEPVQEAGADDPDALAAALETWFARVTPPAQGDAAALLRWLEALAGPDPDAGREDAAEGADPAPADDWPAEHVALVASVRAAAEPEQAARDLHALHALWRVFAGLRTAHDLLDGPDAAAPLAWASFRQELELALGQVSVSPPGGFSRLGRVLACDVLEARGLPHDHVFVCGLAEGLFPAPVPPPDLIQEGERRALNAAGIALPTAADQADDLSLFYQVIGLPRRTLTLSRFTVDDAGALVPPSPYWTAAVRALDVPREAVERIGVGAAPDLDDAATLTEAAVAAASLLAAEGGGAERAFAAASLLAAEDGGAERAFAAHNALLSESAWQNVLRGRALEARREDPRAPFDRHTGVLSDPALVARAAAGLGPERVWSASQLNDYGVCPFRFFARRLLSLEELKEPEEGLDALALGSINHAILERTYRAITREGLAIAPENLPRALALLATAAEAVFAAAPAEYGFRPSPLWAQEQVTLRRRLAWLIEQDFMQAGPFTKGSGDLKAQVRGLPRRPYRQEAAFGLSGEPPVTIDGPAGPIRVRGMIDRLDRAGDAVVVIDYKTGTTPHPVEDMRDGRDFQMMIYLAASEALLARWGEPAAVAGGLFWHIRDRKTSGDVLAADEALDSARERLHAQVQDARAGFFGVLPRKLEQGGRCAAYCEFSKLCRATRGSRYKPRPGGDA